MEKNHSAGDYLSGDRKCTRTLYTDRSFHTAFAVFDPRVPLVDISDTIGAARRYGFIIGGAASPAAGPVDGERADKRTLLKGLLTLPSNPLGIIDPQHYKITDQDICDLEYVAIGNQSAFDVLRDEFGANILPSTPPQGTLNTPNPPSTPPAPPQGTQNTQNPTLAPSVPQTPPQNAPQTPVNAPVSRDPTEGEVWSWVGSLTLSTAVYMAFRKFKAILSKLGV
jgi:hypothetical protein